MGHFSLFILANLVHDPGAYNAIKIFTQSNLVTMCKHAILILRSICQGIDAILFLRPKLIVFYCEISIVLFQPFWVLRPEQEIFFFLLIFRETHPLSAQLKVVFDLIPLGRQEGGKII